MHRPIAAIFHTAAFDSIFVSWLKQPKSLLYFCTATKEPKAKNYKAIFLTEVLQPNVPDMFCCSVVENRGILLSGCCFCVPSSSHSHVGLLPVTNQMVICPFELFVWTSEAFACCSASAETLNAAASRATLFNTMAFKLISSDCSYIFAEEMDSKDIQGRKVQGFGCFITDNSQKNCLL